MPTADVLPKPASQLLQMPSSHLPPHGYSYPSGPRAAASHCCSVGSAPPAHAAKASASQNDTPDHRLIRGGKVWMTPVSRLANFFSLQPLPALLGPELWLSVAAVIDEEPQIGSWSPGSCVKPESSSITNGRLSSP